MHLLLFLPFFLWLAWWQLAHNTIRLEAPKFVLSWSLWWITRESRLSKPHHSHCMVPCRLRHAARIRAYVRKSNLKRNYGVDETFVDGKPCAICGRAEFNGRRPHVDHDHLTGEVRGILCHNCNTGIGLLGESNLLRALEYLGKAGKRKKKK